MNFIVSILISLIAVSILVLIPWIGVGALDLRIIFGVVVPYAALLTFIAGIVVRVLDWARSPVPFRIPTTAGQQWSFPWVKHSRIDNPKGTVGVVVRMIFEVLLFRSLFRNTRLEYRRTEGGPKLDYEWEKWLWLAALVFHYSFLVIFLRHFRFFMEPIPGFVHLLESLDGFMQTGVLPLTGLGVPGVYLTDMLLMLAVTYLFVRRIYVPQTRYISLPQDYFPLFLILALGTSGILMRYFIRVDITAVKELVLGLIKFGPSTESLQGIGVIFYIHLFLISVLIAYFPFSKLMHFMGVFLSPTRNLSNNSRFVRHINPWNYPVKYHTYEEYEDEFRELMVEAGLPVEKQPQPSAEE
ncbi:MAG: sulfate reduction electron transfer complex DsrMKJOP subunit DsrM [Deltaproteobacteria bacterium]|nr:sulfate reduction electron transfer complex DsrMKJOP subunit DsrM [Deltaproteobacteria bacterium]MBW1922630.1 sulfate reduction electron transfer complex DsrMKJOP subunit DsrM [Deltaproteobacteria bacterium]MBW1949405.1 sulfate reduction electron transfer complex DsrMKJOP subunit DsrM [Deltaproteobacteria bacterium]MBW2008173.1 sulfate reduction electron transfer complex DsrMKJOP subunit DsrM [Deltaproteobacteria bacterium]MBW2102709.1 sulfate reduction electron transfer complex DsrMKJOP sub